MPRSAPSATPIRIGYVPLIDAAPLLVAQDEGFFRKAGLQVQLSPELGWATIRDKLIFDELDAAPAPAGLAFAIHLGLSCQATPVLTALVLNLHGNAITLCRDLWHKGVRDATTLRQLLRSEAPRKLTLATVSPVSSHTFLLRQWLESGGIKPDRDIRLVTIPPPQMTANLESGMLHGFCAGEPWNSLAVRQHRAWCPVSSATLAARHPEKVLLARASFAERRPNEHLALASAIRQACALCDSPAYRPQLITFLASPRGLGLDAAALRPSLLGPFSNGAGAHWAAEDFHIFHRDDANRPSLDKAMWVLTRMRLAGLLPSTMPAAEALAHRIFRDDLFAALPDLSK